LNEGNSNRETGHIAHKKRRRRRKGHTVTKKVRGGVIRKKKSKRVRMFNIDPVTWGEGPAGGSRKNNKGKSNRTIPERGSAEQGGSDTKDRIGGGVCQRNGVVRN